MRYFRALIISIGIHILLALVLLLAPKSQFEPHPKQNYVDLLEKPQLPARPHQVAKDEQEFVRKTNVPPEILSQEKQKKRFSSEDEQNVIEERRAREVALTANRSSSAEAARAIQRKSQAVKSARRGKLDFSPVSTLDKAKREILEDMTGEGIRVSAKDKSPKQPLRHEVEAADGSRNLIVPNFGGAERGVSTVGESLPADIKFGDFTALNTDKNLFYTFYARMEEMTRYRWESYAKAAVSDLAISSKVLMAKDTWTTKLEIILDRYGKFQRAIMQDSSGISTLDSAPVQAFRDAGQFPNPPQEMIKSDGNIHIMYAFSVNVVPRYASSH